MPANEELEQELQVPNGDDQLAFDLGEDTQGAEVEISEDGKAEVKTLSNDENNENSSESGGEVPKKGSPEHEEYSAKVRKRLDKMTAKLREAERREQAALEYAKQVQANLASMQNRVQTLDQGFIAESKGRIESQLSIAEANLQDAVERGDGKAVVEAQKLLSQLIMQQEKLNYVASQRQQAQQVQQVPQTPPQMYPQQQPYRQPPATDPKADEWAENNEWFGKDEVMTHAAFGIHGQLEREGFDLSSDEYYDELNRRIRKEFPHKFKKQQASVSSSAPDVAPATRGTTVSPNGRRTIKLTPSEVAMARKLGVPLEEYAKYVRR